MKYSLKKIPLFVLVLMSIAVCLVFSASAADFNYYTEEDGTVSITGYTGKAADVTIPSKINGKKVTAVSGYAFFNTAIKTVKFPSTVKSVGPWSFAECDKLTSVTFAEGVEEIGFCAFYGCDKLTSVYLPKSIDFIGGNALGCNSLKHVYYAGSKKAWNNVGTEEWTGYDDITVHYNHKHKYEPVSVITKATLSKNGKAVGKCTCGVRGEIVTYAPESIKLSSYSVTYNGKTKTPTVTVKDSKGKTLKKNTDYTVKYPDGRKSPGVYVITVTFKGYYSGTKKLNFKINPATPKITKAVSTKKGTVTVNWSNVTGESGYQVYYATSKDGKYTKLSTVGTNVTSSSKSKLKSKKTYYFKVRAIKTNSKGTVYSAWSKVLSAKIK